MRITVISVNDTEVALVRGTSAFGRRGTFGCPLTVGEAVFIAAAGAEDNLRPGSSLNVETGYESISEFSLQADNAEAMEPCVDPGDYLVRGVVVHVAREGNCRVSVRGLTFDIERPHLGGADPQVGQFVSFRLHGLSLWDTGT